jgi:hypothetical protein
MTTRFKLYNNNPIEKNLVNFIFTEHGKDCFKCYLPDYDIDAIMPFQLATYKTNIKKNINTLAPLNKPLVGIIDEVIDETIIISMAYIDKESLDYKKFEEDSIKNKRLVSCIKQYATRNKLNYINVWEYYIYPIDTIRNEFSLFDYIINHLDNIALEGKFDSKLIESLQQIPIKNSNPITKFKMVSTEGIVKLKKVIKEALDINKFELEIILDSTPNYIITSKNEEINSSHHMLFLQTLEKLGKLPENSVFINYL